MFGNPGTPMIQRKSLHLELVERIRPLIVEGALRPDTKVPGRDLYEQFSVSPTPMREALKLLAAEGLVRLSSNRGAWVTGVTVEDVEEVFPVLGTLEALSGELACARITDEEIAHIRDLHAQMVQSYMRRDLATYFLLYQEIHGAILGAARSGTLAHACEALSARMQRARYAANMSETRWAVAVAEHEQMIIAIEARDGAALSRILVEHMRNKQVSVLTWWSSEEAGSQRG